MKEQEKATRLVKLAEVCKAAGRNGSGGVGAGGLARGAEMEEEDKRLTHQFPRDH